jgi:hypothetical protein
MGTISVRHTIKKIRYTEYISGISSFPRIKNVPPTTTIPYLYFYFISNNDMATFCSKKI